MRILPTQTKEYYQVEPNECELCILSKVELQEMVKNMNNEDKLIPFYVHGETIKVFNSLDKIEDKSYVGQFHFKNGSVIFIKYIDNKYICFFSEFLIVYNGGNLASANIECCDIIDLFHSIKYFGHEAFNSKLIEIYKKFTEIQGDYERLSINGLTMLIKKF